jgi:hypothetical protein
MNNDPIIQELREIRKNIEEECRRKGQTYFEHLLEVQEKFKNRIVNDSLDSELTMKKSV